MSPGWGLFAPDDEFTVKLTPYDLSRARIVFRAK
jgi:translation initiation factor IF-1